MTSETPPQQPGIVAGWLGDPRAPAPEGMRRPVSTRSAAAWIAAPPFQRGLSMTLALASVTVILLLLNLLAVSGLEHLASQRSLYGAARLSLAEGAAPLGPLDVHGHAVTPGTPVAVMSAPAVGISSEVIVEGTAGAQTMLGVGHRRDTVLPCQSGTSQLMARSGAYGGVGLAWRSLRPGDTFTIDMGQGRCRYRVLDQRRAGDYQPPAPAAGQGRLILTTADGLPFMPTGVVRVDAERVGVGFVAPAQLAATIPDSEQPMGTDPSNLFALVLLLELLAAAAIAATWLWRRWGRWQTWIVALPVFVGVFLLAATCVNQVALPNLL